MRAVPRAGSLGAVTFGDGTRVRVRQDHEFGPGPWPAEPTGRVVGAPEAVSGRNGVLMMYWIEFDEPQFDTDGDGPYSRSQVLEKYLDHLGE